MSQNTEPVTKLKFELDLEIHGEFTIEQIVAKLTALGILLDNPGKTALVVKKAKYLGPAR